MEHPTNYLVSLFEVSQAEAKSVKEYNDEIAAIEKKRVDINKKIDVKKKQIKGLEDAEEDSWDDYDKLKNDLADLEEEYVTEGGNIRILEFDRQKAKVNEDQAKKRAGESVIDDKYLYGDPKDV